MFSQLRNFLHFPAGDDKEKLHTYYRSLDYLCSAKEKIEQELYYHFKSHGMDNRLVLYDITSVYFEGSDSQIGNNGYSRNWRPDAEQIVIGLVMSRDGIPLVHYVFEGNRLDKTTVEEVMEDLQKHFSSLGIRNAINPEKLRKAADKQNTAQNQLELIFGE